MQHHQQRVVDELAELSERRKKLAEFITTSNLYATLPYDEQCRLLKQRGIMQQYEAILEERIAAFPQ